MRAASWVPLVSVLVLSGCSAVARHDAVPAALETEARVADMPADIRERVGSPTDEAALAQEFVQSWKRERAHLTSQGHRGPLPPTAFLALSGGGDQGAQIRVPFSVLKAKSHINERAKAANDDPRFSVRIREGLPRMSSRGSTEVTR